MNLLWIFEDRPMPNLKSTMPRTTRIISCLDSNGSQGYEDYLANLYSNSIIEHSPSAWDQLAFFLPHRGLYGNGKLRVVFDGSAQHSQIPESPIWSFLFSLHAAEAISTHLHKTTDIEPGFHHLLKSGIYVDDMFLNISTAAEADINCSVFFQSSSTLLVC
ncbi:hypothetical protein Pmani_007780 [Petrolisthes manimaculis]|uniref:Uncharacterized protein n=1 Tax=Petrolisthes manimaculis TaxID=1843537 RepID=A0AAE1UJQ4_9EUCA|nr:hypothetical protein Pmani_007780 [Petrolisthes manimaculis]